jgi:acyl-CoA-binding protein
MSVEDRFNTALKFIQTLPKDGSIKPSNNQLLAFYSLKKQIDSGKVQIHVAAGNECVVLIAWLPTMY